MTGPAAHIFSISAAGLRKNSRPLTLCEPSLKYTIHEPTLEYHIGQALAIETPVALAQRRLARRRAKVSSSMTMPRSHAYHDLPPRAVLATVIGVMIAMLMAALDQTIVGTAMPRIISELHGFEHYSAVIPLTWSPQPRSCRSRAS
jgi:hypothetical protein